jgi:hypothetical protein
MAEKLKHMPWNRQEMGCEGPGDGVSTYKYAVIKPILSQKSFTSSAQWLVNSKLKRRI